jgi:hypothetical protein
MKGVVRPQHAPTARKLRTHRQIGGEAGATASIDKFDAVVYQADRGGHNIENRYSGYSLPVVPCSSVGD